MSLQIRSVVADYGGAPVLRGVDLDVAAGTLLSVLGASGSGKTTLLRTVAGLHRPRSGSVVLDGVVLDEVVLDGRDLRSVPPGRRGVGLVPQEGALFGHLDVAGNVAFGLRGRSRAARRERVAELLDLVDLAGAGSRMPHELSGGQRQRVALARALAPAPRVVLLDEPFASLDATLRADVRSQVVDVLREAGATAVLITHDQHEALSVSDRVAVLHEGRIAQVGAPRELYARPATAWLAAFLGEATLLPGTGDGRSVRTALGDLPCAEGSPAGTVLAVVRPGCVRLVEPGTPGAPTGTVRTVEFTGAAQHVQVDGPGGVAVAVQAGAVPQWRRGDRAGLAVEGEVHVVTPAATAETAR